MLPTLSLLEKIPQQILKISNRQGEYKRKAHYCCYLLCQKAGLRVSEAINFDLSAKNKHGLYRLNKTKGKKERYVYIPKKVVKELKKSNWKPQQTNRFNFYHFLRKIKKELGISQNVELTPHTLRRSFATYHAEAGLPLPLLSKLLGHKSMRTTALYWMNIHHGGNDDDSDVGSILAGKFWLEKPQKPKPESETPVRLNLEESPELLAPNLLASESQPNYLSKIQQLEHKLSRIHNENKHLKAELTSEREQEKVLRKVLRQDLAELSEQNTILHQQKAHEITQREQIQQELATAKETISQLAQELTNEREQRITAENNLLKEKALLFTQKQSNQTLQETNTNLMQQIANQKQNHTNLINTYQITLKDKQTAEKQVNYYEQQLKSIVQTLYQWQKLNYYQQLEKQRTQMEAKILHPPPWKPK